LKQLLSTTKSTKALKRAKSAIGYKCIDFFGRFWISFWQVLVALGSAWDREEEAGFSFSPDGWLGWSGKLNEFLENGDVPVLEILPHPVLRDVEFFPKLPPEKKSSFTSCNSI
jgi:hypothetical protein